MRLRITHETVYSFDSPATYAIQTLRLMPRSSAQQFVTEWRIDVSRDCRLAPVEDPFGNLTHSFSIDGPIEELKIVASGEVETEDTAGMVRGTPERMPLTLYRRDTALTDPSPAIRTYAAELRASRGAEPLGILHGLMGTLRERMTFDTEATSSAATATAAFEAGEGTAQDFAHVFLAAARAVDIPCRYVAGYRLDPRGAVEQRAVHAWAEAFAGPGLGWIGFDPVHDWCPSVTYVRCATGLDHLDAMPIRGTRYNGRGETAKTRIVVEEAK